MAGNPNRGMMANNMPPPGMYPEMAGNMLPPGMRGNISSPGMMNNMPPRGMAPGMDNQEDEIGKPSRPGKPPHRLEQKEAEARIGGGWIPPVRQNSIPEQGRVQSAFPGPAPGPFQGQFPGSTQGSNWNLGQGVVTTHLRNPPQQRAKSEFDLETKAPAAKTKTEELGLFSQVVQNLLKDEDKMNTRA